MGKYAHLNGRDIVTKVRQDIARHGVEMSLMAEYDHLPVEHRMRIRKDATAAIYTDRMEALADLNSWAEKVHGEATKRLNANPIGTPAEESRRVAMELRINRLVESARSSGRRDEVAHLIQRASDATAVGNIDDADVFSRAALELDPSNVDAREIANGVTLDRQLADPVKAAALRDLADVDVQLAAFHRDVNATVAQSLQDSMKLANVLGEKADVTRMLREAGEASMTAKVAAVLEAQRTGTKYEEPVGALPGIPQNLDPRGPAQPWGAHLDGSTNGGVA